MHVNTIQTDYRLRLHQLHEGMEPIVVRSPGTVNLIGDHTDYDSGLAMPATIDRFLYISVSKRDDDLLFLKAEGFESVEIRLSDLYPSYGEWHTYVQGVIAALVGLGHSLCG